MGCRPEFFSVVLVTGWQSTSYDERGFPRNASMVYCLALCKPPLMFAGTLVSSFKFMMTPSQAIAIIQYTLWHRSPDM
ncbi:MAG: hypothetical protein KIT26_03290 [Nitrosomonas sp.]|nr:hypothetical protein [Nitrosomonas sp.]